MLRYLLACLLVFFTTVAAEVADDPEMPLSAQDSAAIDADITIIRQGKKTIHEYRANGKIYKIKVIPDIGPSYYFIDPDGDGEMEGLSESDLDSLIKINQWTIFSW